MAKEKLINIVKNISYTFVANVFSLIVSFVLILVIPRYVGVEAYGYYQLYLFYACYVGVLYFGWCDGIYLRLGGAYYKDLDKPLYATQFKLLGIMETVIYLCIYIGACIFAKNIDKRFVIECTCFVAVGLCLRWFITYILQATSRIKEFAIVTISERILVIVLTISLIICGYRDFKLIIVSDIVSKYVSLGIGMYFCRDIAVTAAFSPIRTVIPEIRENMSVGIKLMFSSLSSMLIIGVIRFSVEHHWDISIFSKISLSISLSNMVIMAVNSIAVVLYPLLRRTSQGNLNKIYRVMRVVLMSIVFGGCAFYYPAKSLLSVWLPQYKESLRYAAVLLPICVYESKMSMLINTYYNTFRLEKLLMRCNVTALALSVILALISTVVLNSVMAAIMSILIVTIFRCVISEQLLSKHIEIHVSKDILLELLMTVSFIIFNWYFGFAGMIAYSGCYILYLLVKRKDIVEALSVIFKK